MLQVFHLNVETVDRVLHMLQLCRWLVDRGTTRLAADLDEGAAVQGLKEGSTARDGMQRCMTR